MTIDQGIDNLLQITPLFLEKPLSNVNEEEEDDKRDNVSPTSVRGFVDQEYFSDKLQKALKVNYDVHSFRDFCANHT